MRVVAAIRSITIIGKLVDVTAARAKCIDSDGAATKKPRLHYVVRRDVTLTPRGRLFTARRIGTGVCGLFQDKLQHLRTAIVFVVIGRGVPRRRRR